MRLTITVLLCILTVFSFGQSYFQCQPCGLDCDTLVFEKPGECPHCHMGLYLNPDLLPPVSLLALREYEGTYEYVRESTLDLIASGFDTLLYALIDGAKYPLYRVAPDSFLDGQNNQVTFRRTASGRVTGYQVNGAQYLRLNRIPPNFSFFPKKEWYHKPEDYPIRIPDNRGDGLATGQLREAFTNPAPIQEMVREVIAGNYPDVHSILIIKDNRLVLEEYFYGYGPDSLHQLRSATKPIIGAQLGLAIEQRHIGEVDDPLLPYFSEEYDSIRHLDDLKRSITIADMLTYRHGMDCQNDNPESAGNELTMMASPDWVKHTLDLPMVQQPGRVAEYCSGCPQVIGRLVELSTGENIEAFAKKHFFDPLDITDYRWRFDPDPSSSNTYNQLYLTPRHLAKIALMYLNGGTWQGKRILPAKWVDKTFAPTGDAYGFFWEHISIKSGDQTHRAYLASGNGGQKIHIWPDHNMITIFNGGNYNSYLLYGKSTPPNELIPRFILPALR